MRAAVSGNLDEVRGHAINAHDIISSALKTGIDPLYTFSGEARLPLTKNNRAKLKEDLKAYRYAYSHPEKLIAAVKDARKQLRAYK